MILDIQYSKGLYIPSTAETYRDPMFVPGIGDTVELRGATCKVVSRHWHWTQKGEQVCTVKVEKVS